MATMTKPEKFARRIIKTLQDAGFEALFAGGCVRDMLLHKQPEDYDIATNALPNQVRSLFGHRRTLAIGLAFGVIEILGSKQTGNVQVATFRSDDSYTDGRHPDRVVFSSAAADAQRRDFTINGMFYDPVKEQFFDYVGGQRDLKLKMIRAIGNPNTRFQEDRLRLLRAIRFSTRFGFELEATTKAAIMELAPLITTVSAERITDELRRMFQHPVRGQALKQTFDSGLLEHLFPEIHEPISENPRTEHRQQERILSQVFSTLKQLDHAIEYIHSEFDSGTRSGAQQTLFPESSTQNARFILSMTVLINGLRQCQQTSVEQEVPSQQHSVASPQIICRRMKLSNYETHHICWLVASMKWLMQSDELPLSTLKRRLAHPCIKALLVLHYADSHHRTTGHDDLHFCINTLKTMPEEELCPPPLVDGHDLIRQGIEPGPRIGEILENIRDAQLESAIRTRKDALQFIKQQIRTH